MKLDHINIKAPAQLLDREKQFFLDLLGLTEHTARFVEDFMAGQDTIQGGLNAFVQAVKNGTYPREEHTYS